MNDIIQFIITVMMCFYPTLILLFSQSNLAYNYIISGMLATEKNNDVVQQIKKLTSRISNLKETKMKYFDYIIKMQEMFAGNSKAIKSQIEQFEDLIINKSFYSIGKCQNVKRLVLIYKDLCMLIENFCRLNIAQIKKLDINTSKPQDKVKKKSDNFIKIVNQYNSSELEYNKSYKEYQNQCKNLDDMMLKSQYLVKPVNFYNLKIFDEQLKNLDKKFNQTQNKQGQLISSLQYLDQKRKVLSENIRDIKDDYLILLHTHMTNIEQATGCLADSSKDEMQKIPIDQPRALQGDGFNQRIERFDQKYGKISQNQQLFSDLKQLFMTNSQEIEITTDQRLFLDRCQTFIQKKSEGVEQFIQIQKKLIQQILNQINNCQKLQKQTSSVQKSIFKSNGAEDFKKNIRKYFGQGTSNLVQLSFILIDVPMKRLGKIGTKLQSYDEKLKKIVIKKQQDYRQFKKKVNQLLSEHVNASKGVQNNLASISQFKGNIEKTFSLFKNAYDVFIKEESNMDSQFDQAIYEISNFVLSQIKKSLMNYTLNKKKENFLYNIYKNFNPDTEIIQIVKQDTRYEVLFNDSLRPNLAEFFKSSLAKKRFQETKKILQKKQNQSRGIIGNKEIGCCGLQRGRVQKFSKIKSHNAKLIFEGQIIKQGKLQILDKGLRFQQMRKNPFGQKLQLIIPKKQILSFSCKNSSNVIDILTNMGPISFQSEQSQEIGQGIEKNLGTKLATKDHNGSRLDRSDSSFLKQNNSSTEYKVSFEKSVLTPDSKNSLTKASKSLNVENIALKKLIQSWKKTKLFLDSFVLLHFQESSNSIRVDYKYQDDLNKFLLKQKRNFSQPSSSTDNALILKYQWKVSFPDMPMLKSFIHGQEVKIQILTETVKINITEANRGESHLYVRKTFYNQVTAMNEKLVSLIVEVCQREAHVFKSEEPESQESTILLDLQNLALDKQEVVVKQEKVLKKLSSMNQGIQSQKGDLKQSRISEIK